VASLLDGAPVISSTGKAFPVEERYRRTSRTGPFMRGLRNSPHRPEGNLRDILVFLPGGGEIRACCESLRTTLKSEAAGISIHLFMETPF